MEKHPLRSTGILPIVVMWSLAPAASGEQAEESTCNPAFKLFFRTLLEEIKRTDKPSDSRNDLYDVKIKVTKQDMSDIEALLEEENGRIGTISHILLDLKPHEPWMWFFRGSNRTRDEIVLLVRQLLLCVLIMVLAICILVSPKVSYIMHFKRQFAMCFFVSVIWNWFYLYKTAFAEHQNKLAELFDVKDQCYEVIKLSWIDNLKGWFSGTSTLDDPCRRYYEVLIVNPILLVPPIKAVSVTAAIFIIEPVKHLGQGVGEFLQALLKDLPIILQIPALVTVVFAIVVCIYNTVQAAVCHGVTVLFRYPQSEPEPPEPVRLLCHCHLPQRGQERRVTPEPTQVPLVNNNLSSPRRPPAFQDLLFG